MRIGRVIEWTDAHANPMTIGDKTVTPVARALSVRWPGGGTVWSAPAAIIVEREGRVDRLSIADINRRILWGLRLTAAAVVASGLAHHRGRKDSND